MKNYVLNCESCGGALEYSPDGLSAVCPYCGNKYNFRGAKSEALTLALNRANAMRAACDFDGAMREYTLITERNPGDAEAWWGLVLSKYGIEYVRDPRSGLRFPTCRRTINKSILSDESYLNAIKYAAPAQAEQYKSRAADIERLQSAIKSRLAQEEDYDVFLSFRSADENGAPTKERMVARRIYDELTRRGIKTFYSEESLKGRLGEDYEPIIYKALYSCKFFILIAACAENINTPWVKNEWSRFRDRAEEEGLYGACCAVFCDISPSDLPPFLRSRQGVNLAKYPAGGYEIELADNIESLLSRSSFRTAVKTGAKAQNISGTALLTRAWQDLADEMYESANTKFLQALEADPYCGEAWWGCFLAGHNAYSAGLAAQNLTYEDALTLKNDRNLKNAERYGDGELKGKIANFRKMCAFRSSELAAACDAEANALGRSLGELAEQRKSVAALREKKFKKLERCRKTASRDPKIMIRMLAVAVIFFIMIFSIIGVVAEEAVLFYVGMGMAGMCALAMIMSYFAMKHNVAEAKSQSAQLEADIAGLDERLRKMGEEREKGEIALDEKRRQSAAFKAIFNV